MATAGRAATRHASRTSLRPGSSTRRRRSTPCGRHAGSRRTSRGRSAPTATGCSARAPPPAVTRASPTAPGPGGPASSAGSSPAATTSTSCPCSRGSCASWPTGRPRSSSAATSPSSRCSATRGASAMGDHLARAYGFLARGDMGGSRVVASPYGRAVYTDELPLRHDGNYFWVERDAEPEALVSEASRLDRPLLFVPDPATGNRLEPWFREHGWRIERHVVMAQLREPEPGAAVSLVQEVSEKELRPPR